MRAAFVSFRLGGHDGVAVESLKWQTAFASMGWQVTTVAGEGTADLVLPGLALGSEAVPDLDLLADALTDADLVVIENLLSIPLNPRASAAVASTVRDRPVLLRHHDLPWQHPAWDLPGWTVPDDSRWQHTTLSRLSCDQLLARTGIRSRVMRNRFDILARGDREATRRQLGVAPDEVVVLQPTRALARKNLPASLSLAEHLGATWWLTGSAEGTFAAELDDMTARARTRVIHRAQPQMADAYAACDVVAFPSIWEGFGNPPLEAGVAGKPVAVGSYPVGVELVGQFGFRWHDAAAPSTLETFLREPDPGLLEHNRSLVGTHFDLDELAPELRQILQGWGW